MLTIDINLFSCRNGVNRYHCAVIDAEKQPDTVLDLDEFLPFRLAFTSNLAGDLIATSYVAQYELRVPEWRLITVIAENEGLSQQAICARTRMDKITVGRIACALEERGFVERASNISDRRCRLLTLSAKGRATYDTVVPKALLLEARLLGALAPGEATRFVTTLGRIEEAARTALVEGEAL